MLPSLSNKNKNNNQIQYQASQIKLYNPPKQLTNADFFQSQKKSMNTSSRNNTAKVRAGGFKKATPSQMQSIKKDSEMILQAQRNSSDIQNNYSSSMNNQNYYTNQNNMKYVNQIQKLNSTKDLAAQIKLIQKKIRYHKKKLQEQKKKKQQMQKQKNDPHSQDFQKIIKRQMQLHGYNQNVQKVEEQKGFDYLTNPNKNNQQPQQPQQVSQPLLQVIIQKRFNIQQKIQKLQKHYQNNLRKKFQRRQMFPHFPCKRKTPKLYITSQTNTLQKYGKKPAQQQHIFRVMTKQCTPQQIYPTIPQFSVVKDNLARNVLAYLGDYKPFLEKTKEGNDEIDQNKEDNGSENNFSGNQGDKRA